MESPQAWLQSLPTANQVSEREKAVSLKRWCQCLIMFSLTSMDWRKDMSSFHEAGSPDPALHFSQEQKKNCIRWCWFHFMSTLLFMCVLKGRALSLGTLSLEAMTFSARYKLAPMRNLQNSVPHSPINCGAWKRGLNGNKSETPNCFWPTAFHWDQTDEFESKSYFYEN